jgi:hypothetical protein
LRPRGLHAACSQLADPPGAGTAGAGSRAAEPLAGQYHAPRSRSLDDAARAAGAT